MAGITLDSLKKTERGKETGHRILTLFSKFLQPTYKFSMSSPLNKQAQSLGLTPTTQLPLLAIEVWKPGGRSWSIQKQNLRSENEKETAKKYILGASEVYFTVKLQTPAVKGLESIPLSWIDKQNILAPTTAATGGGSESLGVRAETLIIDGVTKDDFMFMGKPVKVKCFDSAQGIKSSIVNGLKKNSRVSDVIIDTFKAWGKKNWNTITWKGNIPDNEINQLGKYGGEVITGVMGFEDERAFHWQGTNPLAGTQKKVKFFCVPIDPAFAGVDTFLELQNGCKVAISNKYGKGAAASFFANILPYAMKYKKESKARTTLRYLIEIAESKGVTPEKMKGRGAPSKQILYEYGFRHILNISPTVIRDPYSIYTKIKQGINDNDIAIIINSVKTYLDDRTTTLLGTADIEKHLPKSLTSFFARVTAEQLNQKENLDPMIDILAGKNFWQANLDARKWKEGIISYSMFNSGEINLQIIGSKGAIKDIEMKEGMINYFMGPKS